jgi:hypothetical protein
MSGAVNRWRALALTLGVAGATVILGCGDDSGLARRYKVTGMVTYKGQPVRKGTIAFEPANPPLGEGRHASGFIENGSYTLTTAIEGDGALPGDYNVMISSSDLDTRELAKGGLLHQGDLEHQKALKASKSPIPLKYAQSATSKLKAKVVAGPNNIGFDLKDE